MSGHTYLIAGGGTSGHINPAIAVADAIMDARPDSRIIFFVTESGIEHQIVRQTDYPYRIIRAYRYPDSLRSAWLFARETLSGYRTARQAIDREKPVAALGTGGFVCSPLMQACISRQVPFVLHEQNAFPGKSNRHFAKKAAAVCISFEDSRRHFKTDSPIILTGNPVRKAFFTTERSAARAKLGLAPEQPVVLVMGGSLGAKNLNQTILQMAQTKYWQKLKTRFPQLMMAISAGYVNAGDLSEQIKQTGVEGLLVESYLDSVNWLAACDLFVGRSGASSCLEVAASAKPSILIPFPYAANDHQYANAISFVEHGAAELLQDKELNAEVLWRRLDALLSDSVRLAEMAKQASRLAKPDAAADIAAEIFKVERSCQ